MTNNDLNQPHPLDTSQDASTPTTRCTDDKGCGENPCICRTAYDDLWTPITSHRHGRGKYAREKWGSKESCAECMADEARLVAGREWLTDLYQEEQDKRVNSLLQKDTRYSFSPTVGEVLCVAWLVFAFFVMWGVTQ